MIKPFDARKGKRLPKEITSNLRFFGFFIGNQTLLMPDNTDISLIFEPSNALGELYLIKLFGKYDVDFSYDDQRLEKGENLSSKTYIQALNHKSPLKLPLSVNQLKNGTDWRYAIVRFMLDLGNRNLTTAPLVNIKHDYCDDVIDYGNSMEMITAIFCNTLRMDNQFNVINEEWVRYRTSQYIRMLNDDTYKVFPPFKEWEMMLWL